MWHLYKPFFHTWTIKVSIVAYCSLAGVVLGDVCMRGSAPCRSIEKNDYSSIAAGVSPHDGIEGALGHRNLVHVLDLTSVYLPPRSLWRRWRCLVIWSPPSDCGDRSKAERLRGAK